MESQESDLYGLPLDEFIPARTELEKRLRKEGERERAAAVKKLPKPSVAAWAVNQASRSQPKDRRELLRASTDLRDAQERLIAGDAKAADLEKAAARQRAAIDALVDAASGLLTADGEALGEATLARVRETLAAVAADEELAELVEAGTLDRERRPAGLGFGFATGGLADADEDDEAPPKPAGGRPRGGAKPKRAAKPGSAKTDGAAKSGGSAKTGGSAEERPSARERKAREKEERRRKKARAAARERVKAAKAEERDAAQAQKAAERDARKAAEALERAESAAQAARGELDASTEAAREALAAREAAEAERDALG